MIVPESYHYINDSISFLIGVSLNALLMWLIVKRSPSQMGQYRPILLLTTFMDIVYLVDFLLVVPVTVVDGGSIGFFSLGPLSSLPNPWGFAVVMTWVFLISFREITTGVPFIFRYYVICHGKTWGLSQFLAILLVPTVLCIEHVFVCYYFGYVPTLEDQLAANRFFGFPNDSNKTYMIPFFATTPVKSSVIFCNVALFIGINYVLLVIFGRRLYRHLNAITGLHSSQEYARMLNNEISTTLLLQAIIPLLVEFLPTAEVSIMMISGASFTASSLYILAVFAWIPVLNPLVSMWVVKAYRREIQMWIERIRGKIATVPTIMPVTTAAPNAWMNEISPTLRTANRD